MAEFYRQFAFVSSVLAGFSFTFYGTLLIAARQHRAGTWAAFLAVAASVAFLPVTLGMTFTAARATNQPSDFSISKAAAIRNWCCSRCCSSPVWYCLFASFGVSGWIRSRGLGIATTSLSLIGATAAFTALKPFLGM